jgi:hypothetical protein
MPSEAALQASECIANEQADQERAVALELEPARYEERLASRRYEGVDPENRLVAAELESRWNAAIARTREIELRLEQVTGACKGLPLPN